ncbi:hypothetical protein AM504_01800 [Klebsiella michiganensis]|nr:hypothetical protein ABE84_27820 [Klebsiella michiganensis]KLU46194.1 hypothetical protein ABE97_15870 [Klebsiella michiganensis]
MKRYSLIYADPAWSYGNQISNGAAVDHYPTMSLLDMKRLPVWELAADNAVLAMWYTGTHNQEAIELAPSVRSKRSGFFILKTVISGKTPHVLRAYSALRAEASR